MDAVIESLAMHFGRRYGDIRELTRDELIKEHGATVHPHVLEVLTDPTLDFRYFQLGDRMVVYDFDGEYMHLVDLRYDSERGLHPVAYIDM